MYAQEEYGFVGNVWVRQNCLQYAGDKVLGHAHYHDHVSFLTNGSLRVTVNDGEPKDFFAPTFIVIKKQYRHQMVALEDNTIFYCVFAMRDIDGQVVDIYSVDNLPNLPEIPEYVHAAPEGTWGHATDTGDQR